MTPLRAAANRTFKAMRHRNFRLFAYGNLIANSGTWLSNIATAWLALKLTESPAALGATLSVRFGPMLILGSWGGLLVDRFDKRKILIVSAVAACVQAVVLGVLVQTGTASIWSLYLLILALGLISA